MILGEFNAVELQKSVPVRAGCQGKIPRMQNSTQTEQIPRFLALVGDKSCHNTHPVKEDVKKKNCSPPLGEMRVW